MILVVSDNDDKSTNEVIDWLIYYNANFIRINDADSIKLNALTLEDKTEIISFNVFNDNVNLSDISCAWFRRGGLTFDFGTSNISFQKHNLSKDLKEFLFNQINYENFFLKHFLSFYTFNRPNINHILHPEGNKLINLLVAKSFEIQIPKTKIISNKLELIDFYDNNKNGVISKLLSPGIVYKPTKFTFEDALTTLVDRELIDSIDDTFPPTLFQENLDKEFELRIFYLSGSFYASAIFSQLDQTTTIDFRNYNESRPNRVVPFILDKALRNKLDKLMKKLNFSSGSIDIVVTKKKEYVFLEVNPLGQFAQVSFPCNYYIERDIAKKLINYEEKYFNQSK